MTTTLTEIKRRKLERALERRYGQSMLPLETEDWSENGISHDRWRCKDLESGAFIIGQFDGARLKVLAESDPPL